MRGSAAARTRAPRAASRAPWPRRARAPPRNPADPGEIAREIGARGCKSSGGGSKAPCGRRPAEIGGDRARLEAKRDDCVGQRRQLRLPSAVYHLPLEAREAQPQPRRRRALVLARLHSAGTTNRGRTAAAQPSGRASSTGAGAGRGEIAARSRLPACSTSAAPTLGWRSQPVSVRTSIGRLCAAAPRCAPPSSVCGSATTPSKVSPACA